VKWLEFMLVALRRLLKAVNLGHHSLSDVARINKIKSLQSHEYFNAVETFLNKRGEGSARCSGSGPLSSASMVVNVC